MIVESPKTKYELSRAIAKSRISKFTIFDDVATKDHRSIMLEISKLLKQSKGTSIIVLKGKN